MSRAIATLVILALLGCNRTAEPSQPRAAIAPLALSNGLQRLDVCRAIPREDIEAVMGRSLSADPKRFDYYEVPGGSGCWYEARKSSDGEAFFGYVVFTPAAAYETQPLHLNVDVPGLGHKAYFNNGADARQLWVKVNAKTAFVVAFGDQPREDSAKAIAKLLLAAIK